MPAVVRQDRVLGLGFGARVLDSILRLWILSFGCRWWLEGLNLTSDHRLHKTCHRPHPETLGPVLTAETSMRTAYLSDCNAT